ncbi:MAG: RNase H family protein, partial [Pseudomonadales bacterium]
MAKVEIFTDGACRGNPGPGGWGVLMRSNGEERVEIQVDEGSVRAYPAHRNLRVAHPLVACVGRFSG